MLKDKDELNTGLDEAATATNAGDFAGALERTDQLAAKYPDEAQIWELRAHIFRQQGDVERAIVERSKAIQLSGKEPHYFYIRGIDFFGLGKYRQAVSDFTKVIELCDYHKSDYYRQGAYLFRADAFVRLKEYKLARADCEQVDDKMRTWTDRIRTKAEILAECAR
jgi:tetratricopeptide (TPR) repeat protein